METVSFELKKPRGISCSLYGRHAARKNPDGMWRYPSSKDVLKAVGLKTIDYYIGVQRETITRFIVDQPLFALCKVGERMRGSTHRMFWWEQPLSLDDVGPRRRRQSFAGLVICMVGLLYGSP